jgi:hypothetical protein
MSGAKEFDDARPPAERWTAKPNLKGHTRATRFLCVWPFWVDVGCTMYQERWSANAVTVGAREIDYSHLAVMADPEPTHKVTT